MNKSLKKLNSYKYNLINQHNKMQIYYKIVKLIKIKNITKEIVVMKKTKK